MMQESRFDLAWWIWWSNPLQAIHTEHLNELPLHYQNDSTRDFSNLLGLRSLLALPEVPEHVATCSSLIKSACIAGEADRHSDLFSIAALTLGPHVLKYTANEWLINLGIDQPEIVRELIQQWSASPYSLKTWGEQLMQQHQVNNTGSTFNFGERCDLILAAYLKRSAPNVFKRWRLTVAGRLSTSIANGSHLDKNIFMDLESFLQPKLNSLEQKVKQGIQDFTLKGMEEIVDQNGDDDDTIALLLNRISEAESPKNA